MLYRIIAGKFATEILVHGGKKVSRDRGRLVVSPGGGIAHEKPTSVGSGPRKFLRFSSETASVGGREPIKKRPLFGATLFKEAKLAGSQKRLVWRRVGDVQRQ